MSSPLRRRWFCGTKGTCVQHQNPLTAELGRLSSALNRASYDLQDATRTHLPAVRHLAGLPARDIGAALQSAADHFERQLRLISKDVSSLGDLIGSLALQMSEVEAKDQDPTSASPTATDPKSPR
jgi:hypothetical protein